MTERVLLGNRGGTYGLFVSKPGQSVLASADFMVSTAVKNLQIVQYGSFGVVFGNPGVAISWTPLGFRPRVLIQTQHRLVDFVYSSDNSGTARFTNNQNLINAEWNAGGSPPPLSNTVYWSVLSVPN